MKFRRPLDTERHCVSVTTAEVDAENAQPLPGFVTDCIRRHSKISAHYADYFKQSKRRGSTPNSLVFSVSHSSLPADDTEEEARLIELSHMEQCQSEGRIYTGEYFTLLVTHSVPGRTNAYVGYTGNPLQEAARYNAKHGGGWKADIAIGPHPSKQVAMDCGLSWVTLTRGQEPKRVKGAWLASAYNRPIYTFSQEPEQPLELLLEQYADPAFLDLYREMYGSVVAQ